MNDKGYFEVIKQASENVSKYDKRWSARHNERWGQHEATWKALLFHELILIDAKLKDNLSMENTPETKNRRTKGKRIDIWLGDSDNMFVIEVKLIKYKKRKSGYGFSRLNSRSGVYGDLLKLQGYLTSVDGNGANGIVIAVHEVGNGENRKLDVNKIVVKVKQNLVDLLNEHLRLLICSNGKCVYAP